MNKKLFSAVLMGALLFGGTFVSCKDYDDDIENLQNQINKLASSSELSSQVSTLQSAISAAQGAAEAKAAAAQTVADAAKGAANDAASAAKAAQEAADKVAADLDAANKDLAGKIEAAQAAADKASQNLEAALDAAKGEITKTVEAAQAAADKAAADLAALQASVEANTAAIEAAAKAAKAAQAAADSKATPEDVAKAAQKAADDLKAAKEELEGKLSALEAELNKVKESLKSTTTSESLEAANEAIKKIEESLKELTNVTGKRLTSLVFAPTNYINGIEAIKFTNLTYKDWGNNSKYWSADKPSAWKVISSSAKDFAPGQVLDFGAEVKYLVSPDGVTLKGIESLEFKTNDAKNTRAAKAADVTLTVVDQAIEDGKLVLNVKKEIAKDINGNDQNLPVASTSCNDDSENMVIASLKATLADAVKTDDEKGQEVAVWSDWARVQESEEHPRIHNSTVRDAQGQLTTTGANASKAHFFSYSEIYDSNARTAASAAANLEGFNAVYQYDEDDLTATPATTGTYRSADFIGIEHIYNTPLNLLDVVTVCTFKGDWNSATASYDNTVDLNEIADYAKYGLEFKFDLMPYVVKNDGTTKDSTDQALFAELKGTILTPLAENGTPLNANAIGRTPVIRVVLVDTKKTEDTKDDQVVDVRYFKVKWTEENPASLVSTVGYEVTHAYACAGDITVNHNGEEYSGWIYEQVMNNIYAAYDNNKGISKDQFKNRYTEHSPYIYAYDGAFSVDALEAYDFTDETKWIGKTYWREDASATSQTQNVEVDFDAFWVNPRVDTDGDGDLFDGIAPSNSYGWKFANERDFTVKGFFYLSTADKTSRFYIPVTLNVKKNQIYSQYVQTQWNTGATTKAGTNSPEADKYRSINPTLRSDTTYGVVNSKVTTQLIGSISRGYIYNGQIPAYDSLAHLKFNEETEEYKLLVANKEYDGGAVKTTITFDATRLGNLPTITDPAGDDTHAGYIWFVYGNTLYYGKPTKNNYGNITGLTEGKGTAGAKIVNDLVYLVDNKYNTTEGGTVVYNNNYSQTTGVPTEAARLLVDQMVPVVVTAKQCVQNVAHDKYYFKFIKPLNIQRTDYKIKDLVDVQYKGDSVVVSVDDILTIKENYLASGNKTIYFYEKYKACKDSAENVALKQWYGIDKINIDNDHILTNLNKNGGTDNGYYTILNDLKKPDGTPLYKVTFDNKVTVQGTTPVDTSATDIKVQATKPTGYAPIYEADGTTQKTQVKSEDQCTGTQKEDSLVVKTAYDTYSVGDTIPVAKWTNVPTDVESYTYVYDANLVVKSDTVKAANYQPAKRPAFKNGATYYDRPGTSGVEVTNAILRDSVAKYYYVPSAGTETEIYEISDGVFNTQQTGSGTKISVGDTINVYKHYKASNGYHFKNETCTGDSVQYGFAMVPVLDEDGNNAMNQDGSVKLQPKKDAAMVAGKEITTRAMKPAKNAVSPTDYVKVWGKIIYNDTEVDTVDGSGTIRFHNMSGDAIAPGKSFKVAIPVVIKTKWEEALTGLIEVTIKSGL